MRQCLPYGDYHAEGDDTYVERKSVADLFHSFTHEYENEKAKWTRAQANGHRYILAIEATISEVRKGHSYWKAGEVVECKKSGLSQIRQILSIERKYGITSWWCNGRADMAFRIVEFYLAGERMRASS